MPTISESKQALVFIMLNETSLHVHIINKPRFHETIIFVHLNRLGPCSKDGRRADGIREKIKINLCGQ